MAQFRFKLEAVYKQRQMIEDERQRDLAKLLRRRMILENQLRTMQQTITDSKRQLGDGLVGRVDLDRIGQFARYSGQVTLRAHQLVQEIARVVQQSEAARAKLAEALRARKAIELLRDRQFAQWKQTFERREAARLDELAVQQYARKLAGGVWA